MILRWNFYASLLLYTCQLSLAQYTPEGRPDPPGTPKRTKTKYSVVPEEAKFLKCDVCKTSVHVMHQAVADLRSIMKKNKKLTEEQVLEVVEGTCKPFSDYGLWLLHTDIRQPEEDKLEIVARDFMTRCKNECETLARACHDTLGDVDTDVAELVYQDKHSAAQLTDEVCFQLTDACTKRRSVTKPHVEEKVTRMSQKEYDMFKMIEETNYGGGRGGLSLYSRDDIEDSLGGGSGGEEGAPADPSAHAADQDIGSSQEGRQYYDEEHSGGPPDDVVPWMAWNVHRATRWVQSFFVDDSQRNEL